MAKTYDLGAVTAYAIAVEHGYEGTEQEWIEELMETTANAQLAKDSADFVETRTFGAVIRDHGVQIDEKEVQTDSLTQRAEAANTAAQQAKTDAEAYAVGKRNGVDVGSSDATYQNNAKYYATSASGGANVADVFSTSKAYTIGDYVLYNGLMYRFTTAHPAGAWNASHVTAVKVMDEVTDLKDDLNETVRFTEQSLTEAQKVQVKLNIGVTDEGLSDAAKQALLNCLEKVMWINESGKNLLNSLRSALYSDWDYVWSASSGTLPDGLTKIGNATWGPNNEYVDIENPDFIIGYGDFKAEFEIAYVSTFGSGSTSIAIILSNHANHAVKMNYDDNGVFAIRSNSSPQVIDITSLHLYSVTYVNGKAILYRDGEMLGEYQNFRSVWNDKSLVYRNPAYTSWDVNKVVLRFRSLKYKILGNVENNNIIYLYKGYGISSQDYSTIIENNSRCTSEPIPFINNTSISIQLSQEFASWANLNGNIYLKISTDDSKVHYGVDEFVKRYNNGSYVYDGAGGLMNSSDGEYRIVNTGNTRIKCENTNGTFRLLLGIYNPSSPVGTITITGKTYMLVVKDSGEFR